MPVPMALHDQDGIYLFNHLELRNVVVSLIMPFAPCDDNAFPVVSCDQKVMFQTTLTVLIKGRWWCHLQWSFHHVILLPVAVRSILNLVTLT